MIFNHIANLLILLATANSFTHAARVQVRNLPGVKPAPSLDIDDYIYFGDGHDYMWFEVNADRTVEVQNGHFSPYWRALGSPDATGAREALQMRPKDEIAFVFAADPSYVHPCGQHHGLELVCSGPHSTCAQIGVTDFSIKE